MRDNACPFIDLERFFSPRSIAVIGASSDGSKLGYKILNNIITGGFKGSVHPVNPKGGSILGMEVYRDISEIGGEVDLAIISLPSAKANDALRSCGERGIPFAIIVSAGFREIGNVEGEEELVRTARSHGMRLLGPNVFGSIYTPAGLNAQFGPANILPGNVAIITQSGALGASLMGKVVDSGIGISGVVSTGNKADLDDVDILSFFCSDRHTKVILMYIEGLKDGRRFLQVIGDLARNKPIIVLKSGRTEEGARAVRSHTASMAGKDRVFDGAFRQSGVLRAKTVMEALDWTRALVNLPLPSRDNVLIITNGGGLGALAVDGLIGSEIPLYDDREWIRREMGRIYPSYATFDNPVDITAQASYDLYLKGLERAISEPGVGSVIGIYSPTAGADKDDFTKGIVRTVRDATKPVLLCSFGGKAAMDQIADLGKEGIQAFYHPEEAVSTLSALFGYARSLRSDTGVFREMPEGSNGQDPTIDGLGPGFADPATALEIIGSMGIATPEWRKVRDMDSLLDAFRDLGPPVVLKANSNDIVHKSEAGAVETGIRCREHLLQAHDRIRGLSTEQIMMRHVEGIQMIAGAFRDPVFGPCVMFGAGGTMVEFMDDVAFRVAPIGIEGAIDMIRSTRVNELLGGFRGSGPVDIEAVARVIVSLGEFLVHNDRVEELEINPLMGSEVVSAADCRLRIG